MDNQTHKSAQIEPSLLKHNRPKHTPGPWVVVPADYLSHDAPGYTVTVAPGGILGGTPDDPSWVVEGEIEFAPDARLIAAAPDMLDALRQWKYAKENHDAVELVNAQISRDLAIAKATGDA